MIVSQTAAVRDWEGAFARWATAPGTTELERCDNAVRQVRKAIAASPDLAKRDVRVFGQGSHENRVNVRQDSDVDIGVCCYSVFWADYPSGTSDTTFGNHNSDYSYPTFKAQVEAALVDYFGSAAVVRGNKAFDIKANTYRVEADVAPFLEHRRYRVNGTYLSGVELRPDGNPQHRVINWPQQHYDNAVAKNDQSGRRFKAMVRILKSLRNEMVDAEVVEAFGVPGFLVECLTWNTPNEHFYPGSYLQAVRSTLSFLIMHTDLDATCSEWGEVSELKYLFRQGQKWTRGQANAWLRSAWTYLGLR